MTPAEGSAQLMEQLLSEMKSGQQAMQAGMNDMLSSLQASVAKIGAEGKAPVNERHVSWKKCSLTARREKSAGRAHVRIY